MEEIPRKIRRLSHAVKDIATQTTDENTTTENKSVELTYDVLRIIFKYLNYEDLIKASWTCRTWLEAANREKEIRIYPFSFMDTFNNMLERYPFSVCYKLHNTWIKPQIGIYFRIKEYSSDYDGHYMDTEFFQNRLFNGVHKNFRCIIINCPGVIIGNTEIELSEREFPKEFPDGVCTFLPKIPRVKIKRFTMQHYGCKKFKAGVEQLQTYLDNLPCPNQNTSTCVMLFCSETSKMEEVQKMLKCINFSYSHKIISFWGGIVSKQKMYIGNQKYFYIPICTGIVITGAINTWSIILNKKCKTKKEVEARLTSWRDEITLRKHSIGFMFACFARGKDMYEEENVESTIFKRLFPTVSLVGCFGEGEFGKNTNPACLLHDCRQENTEYCKIQFTNYSTIFMIVTYG